MGTHTEQVDTPLVDYAALDLRDVLRHISASIAWLSTVRDRPHGQPDLGLAAVRAQAELVAEYRLLWGAVDTNRRIEYNEKMLGELRSNIEHLEDS
jgi:hypothetical protein